MLGKYKKFFNLERLEGDGKERGGDSERGERDGTHISKYE
jgi:hypothetical protein